MRGSAIALALLMLAACDGSAGTARQPTATPSSIASTPVPNPTPVAVPPAKVTCASQVPAGDQLALVSLRNTKGVIVRDLTDISRPVSLCTITSSRAAYFRFVDGTHVSYWSDNPDGHGGLYLVDLQTRGTELIRSWGGQGAAFSWVYAWSPDGATLAYLTPANGFGTEMEWHLLSASGDLVLSRLGPLHGHRPMLNDDDAMVGFSADGQYVAFEYTYTGQALAKDDPFQIVRLSDHKLVYSRTDGTMAIWSRTGARLYFRAGSGLNAWDAATGAQLVAANVGWIRPVASADGSRIAYTTLEAPSTYHAAYVRLADQPVAGIQFSRPTRACPAFLSPTLVWYVESVFSGDVGHCDAGRPPHAGRTYVYDLASGTESASIITGVLDSWPHSV